MIQLYPGTLIGLLIDCLVDHVVGTILKDWHKVNDYVTNPRWDLDRVSNIFVIPRSRS